MPSFSTTVLRIRTIGCQLIDQIDELALLHKVLEKAKIRFRRIGDELILEVDCSKMEPRVHLANLMFRLVPTFIGEGIASVKDSLFDKAAHLLRANLHANADQLVSLVLPDRDHLMLFVEEHRKPVIEPKPEVLILYQS